MGKVMEMATTTETVVLAQIMVSEMDAMGMAMVTGVVTGSMVVARGTVGVTLLLSLSRG
jgi:hydroxymethylglutaryl-CoA reductase